MGFEIERKFLVDLEKWNVLQKPPGKVYRQGYVADIDNKTVRVRCSDTEAFLTIKGKTIGATRSEIEFEIPVAEANEILQTLSENEVSKTRYEIMHQEKLWEVDVFHGANNGLVVAEIELEDESENFDLPDWVTAEVTEDPRYYNSNLARYPYSGWS